MRNTAPLRNGSLHGVRRLMGVAVFLFFLASGALAGQALSSNSYTSTSGDVAILALPQVADNAEKACLEKMETFSRVGAAPDARQARLRRNMAAVGLVFGLRHALGQRELAGAGLGRTPVQVADQDGQADILQARAIRVYRNCVKEETLKTAHNG